MIEGSEEVEVGTDGEVDRNDRKVASSWSPFEVMFTSDDIVH
jgi:hypothetical protein